MRKQHAEKGHLLMDSLETMRLAKRAYAIFQRCTNPKNPGYKDYGGRGITCEFESVKALVDYLVQIAPAEKWMGKTIDRIDNNLGYQVGNIRLATYQENNLNRRNSKKYMTS
jgi:hypothetical protein